MIEILCIAAEITAVLLILSIALPTSATQQAQSKKAAGGPFVESEMLYDCEPALLALRSLIYLHTSQAIAGVPETQSNSEPYAAVLHRLRDHLRTIEVLGVSSQIDSVTNLPNRGELERLLDASTEWSPLVDVPTWVGLLQIDNLEPLDEEHGPIASELLLREVASFLRENVGGQSPLVRFNHNSFAIAIHRRLQVDAIEFLESVRCKVNGIIATVGETTITTTATASAAQFEPLADVSDLWERLEDGMVEAISAGSNRGRWFDPSDSLWHPMGPEEIVEAQSQAVDDDSTGHDDEDKKAPKGIDPSTSASSKPSISTNASEKPMAEATEEASNAVTMEDDIAALFAAARAQKGPSIPTLPATDPPKPNKESTNEESTNLTAAATNDDIESLFATFKKSK